MSLVFDTLKLSKSLGRAFTPEQAEALTEALTINVSEGLATKGDLSVATTDLKAAIAVFRTELKTEIADLRTELKTEIADLRTELKTEIVGLRTELKGDIAALRAEMIRWIVGALAFNFVATAGLMFTIAKLVAAK